VTSVSNSQQEKFTEHAGTSSAAAGAGQPAGQSILVVFALQYGRQQQAQLVPGRFQNV
jgi:hypothetical protein